MEGGLGGFRPADEAHQRALNRFERELSDDHAIIAVTDGRVRILKNDPLAILSLEFGIADHTEVHMNHYALGLNEAKRLALDLLEKVEIAERFFAMQPS